MIIQHCKYCVYVMKLNVIFISVLFVYCIWRVGKLMPCVQSFAVQFVVTVGYSVFSIAT
jgi:hypothetical protein